MEILFGGKRIADETLRALNELLRRQAGDYQGMPLYKVSWSGDDNKGLARRHGVSCPKTDPFDWDCECPLASPGSLPRCFHENQASYHLLSWEPPSRDMMAFEEQTGEDYSRGTYACVMHFIDPTTGEPVDPTAAIVEKMVPVLKEMREATNAALHGYNAILRRTRQDIMNREIARQERLKKKRDTDIDAMLRETEPAFGGEAFAGQVPKQKQTADKSLSDLRPKEEQ